MPKITGNQEDTFHPQNRKEWREWLREHHKSSKGVWLVYYKKGSGKSRFLYDEAVEEALCYGWIDSTARKLDDERSMLRFTPRKRGSVWSKINKGRIEKLIKEGSMAEAGLEKIEAAKRDGSWSLLDDIEELEVPEDLEKALAANQRAQDNFMAFNASSKKQLLYWIKSAKRAETRERRIKQLVESAEENKNPIA